MNASTETAYRNFGTLKTNPYPGRGLAIGVDITGRYLVQVYFITGRSAGSRNRVLSQEGGRVFTEPADPAQVSGDPKLTIYNAMRENAEVFVVSNGPHTDAVMTAINTGHSMAIGLSGFDFEPDAPIYTPRIVGTCHPTQSPFIRLAILRKAAHDASCDRSYYEYESMPEGFGRCITTYSNDGNPPPSFDGDPMIMPLDGDIKGIAESYWNALNVDNRVSLAVKMIPFDRSYPSSVLIINKYSRI